MDGYLTLQDISKHFGIDKSNTRKYLLKKGFKFTTVRRKEVGNQKELALTVKQYKLAAKVREEDGFELLSFTES